jgi:hypothetical protein
MIKRRTLKGSSRALEFVGRALRACRTVVVLSISAATVLATAAVFVLSVPTPAVASNSRTTHSSTPFPDVSPAAPVPESAYSTSSTRSNGIHETELSSTPINYKDAQGAWQPINDSLVATTSGGWHNEADSSSV